VFTLDQCAQSNETKLDNPLSINNVGSELFYQFQWRLVVPQGALSLNVEQKPKGQRSVEEAPAIRETLYVVKSIVADSAEAPCFVI